MSTRPFPSERDASRADLLRRVDEVAEVVVATRDQTEACRTLAPEAVDALRTSGLFLLKAPREVGGAEAHPVVQMDVIEALTRLDPAAGWCMFITSAVSGSALARLPDPGVEEVLAGGFPFMAGSLKPGGSARRVDGGFRVSGRWGWGSGVPHADWVSVPVLTDVPQSPVISAVVPATEITVHDTWHTLGMRGTGSADYELDDVFVPERRTVDVAAPPPRGGPLFRMGLPGFVVNEHGAFAYALGQAALDTMVTTAREKKRGYGKAQSIADREVFQRTVGQASNRIRACRLLMADVIERLFDAVAEGEPPALIDAEARSAAAWCTDEAIDVIGSLFRYAGGTAVMTGDLMQRYLRDIYTVQSHLVVSDAAHEILGRHLLGFPAESRLR